MAEQKIDVVFMLEILGRPPEHIKETMVQIVERLGKEKDVRIINKMIAEPKKVEGQQDIYSTFAEVEIETSLPQLMLLIFAYMPAHIDVITPEELKVPNYDFNVFFNELTRRLHQYDELARGLMIERQILSEQIKEGKIRVENNTILAPENNEVKEEKKTRKKKKA